MADTRAQDAPQHRRMESKKHTFFSDFRTFFLKGLGILLPSLVTLGLLLWAFSFLRNNIAEPINAAVRQVVIFAGPKVAFDVEDVEDAPAWYRVSAEELAEAAGGESEVAELTEVRRAALASRVRAESLAEYWRSHWYLEAIGFVVAVIAVYLAGVFVGNYIGKRVYVRLETWLVRVPVIKQVYPNVKQIVQFLIGDEERAMPTSGKVVLVEWPRRDAWTVGLMTSGSMKTVHAMLGEECVTVFIPNSPTPFTGFTVNLPKSDVREIDMTFDEAIRFVVSGGVLVPERQRVAAAEPDTTPDDHRLGPATQGGIDPPASEER